ncbi:Tad domain-containing protein [Rhodobacteraceae bacterium NNCM2]|nr:Tad domain-containing protein [Coraliihabitans acroporae]
MQRTLIRFLVTDQRGALSPMFLVLFIGLLFLTGLSLDLLRQEAARADLQSAIDRGVLAAADLEQTVDPETTVRDYVNTRVLSNEPVNVVVSANETLNYRRVGATANFEQNTIFLGMMGDLSLPVVAASAAEERREHVEISLVLDISGSMSRERTGGTTTKRLDLLKSAAQEFVGLILTDSTMDTTSMSLIPYAGQVNAGVFFDDFLNGSRVHNYSSCVDFTDNDFTKTSFPNNNSRYQTQHFQNFSYEAFSGNNAEWGWCPSDKQAVVPFSNDRDALKAKIRNFVGHDGTGSQYGMKWGLALLDPATQPKIAALSTAGGVPEVFDDRPTAFDNEDALKVIVLMTDGNTRYQPRIKSTYYNSRSERETWATESSRNYLSNNTSKSTLRNSSSQTNDENFRRSQLVALCDLAAANNVVVFTIGFDVSTGSNAYRDMRDCASSSSHFYHVNGLELSTAFQLIAATISKLKLVE